MCPPSWITASHLLPTPSLQAVPECPGFPASCIKYTFAIHSTCGAVQVSVLFFQVKVQHPVNVLQAYTVMCNPQLMRTALTALQSSELSRTLCVPIVGQLVLGKDPRKCINAPTLRKAEDNSPFLAVTAASFLLFRLKWLGLQTRVKEEMLCIVK